MCSYDWLTVNRNWDGLKLITCAVYLAVTGGIWFIHRSVVYLCPGQTHYFLLFYSPYMTENRTPVSMHINWLALAYIGGPPGNVSPPYGFVITLFCVQCVAPPRGSMTKNGWTSLFCPPPRDPKRSIRLFVWLDPQVWKQYQPWSTSMGLLKLLSCY